MSAAPLPEGITAVRVPEEAEVLEIARARGVAVSHAARDPLGGPGDAVGGGGIAGCGLGSGAGASGAGFPRPVPGTDSTEQHAVYSARPMARVIGIDPGLSGALCLIEDGMLLHVADMPVMAKGKGTSLVKNEINPAALATLLRGWIEGARSVRVVVEIVNSRPSSGPPQPCPVCKKDRKAMGSSSVFSMGDTAGCIRGVVAALGCSIEWVSPVTWKRHFQLPGGAAQKELARAHAIKLFPSADLARKKDHNRAEALLIARWHIDRTITVNGEPF